MARREEEKMSNLAPTKRKCPKCGKFMYRPGLFKLYPKDYAWRCDQCKMIRSEEELRSLGGTN